MSKNMKMCLVVVISIIVIIVLLHLGKNWLIPMIQHLHDGAGA